jgi:hypothetical protein
MTNPLIAERKDSTTAVTGIGIAESAVDIYNGVQSGSWVEGGIGALGGGLEVLSLVLDPIGTLGQYAVSWVIEHVAPLRDALNWLAGDADQIAAYAQTWKNVSQAVAGVAADYQAEVTNGTSGWAGPAADAYRNNAGQQGEHITAAGTGAETIGTVVEVVGVLVGVVRGIVRDLVAECISTLLIRLPQWLAELGLTLGLATPHVAASVAALVSKWVGRITDIITKLTRSVEKLRPIMAKLGEIWEAIKRGLQKLRPSGGTASPNAPSTVRSATPTTTPSGSATPTTPSSATPATPSTTTTPSGSADAPTTSGATPTTPSGTTTPSGSADPSTTPHTPPPDVDPTPPASARDYDAAGKTIPTSQLQHPHANLIDDDLISQARANPNRDAIINTNGVPADHPAVRDLMPPDYDPHAGLGEAGWNQQYWPSGDTGRYGNRMLEWPDAEAHPQGFNTPESRTPGVLQPGQTIDRFGSARGDFVSPADTPYPQRGLPPDNLNNGYHQYEVVRPLPVWEGPIAPAMGQPGGGTQYVLPHSVVDLINAGYLREIPL